jgi:threonine dehydrogenase-like Zn-dependent dehydrogenase
MRAMVLDKPKHALQLRDVEKPRPAKGQLLVRIVTCAVCRTDLHVADGELPDPKLPLIPGHQIVGYVEEVGPDVPSSFAIANAFIVDPTVKICAIERALPATPSMAVMRNSVSLMHDSAFIYLTTTMMLRLRRCYAQD